MFPSLGPAIFPLPSQFSTCMNCSGYSCGACIHGSVQIAVTRNRVIYFTPMLCSPHVHLSGSQKEKLAGLVSTMWGVLAMQCSWCTLSIIQCPNLHVRKGKWLFPLQCFCLHWLIATLLDSKNLHGWQSPTFKKMSGNWNRMLLLE